MTLTNQIKQPPSSQATGLTLMASASTSLGVPARPARRARNSSLTRGTAPARSIVAPERPGALTLGDRAEHYVLWAEAARGGTSLIDHR